MYYITAVTLQREQHDATRHIACTQNAMLPVCLASLSHCILFSPHCNQALLLLYPTTTIPFSLTVLLLPVQLASLSHYRQFIKPLHLTITSPFQAESFLIISMQCSVSFLAQPAMCDCSLSLGQ